MPKIHAREVVLGCAPGIWTLAGLVAVASPSLSAPACYYAPGRYGGYYLTDETTYQESLDRLFEVIQRAPRYQVALEIEPYTLERMQRGESFAVERQGREQPRLPHWSSGGPGETTVAYPAEAAHPGKRGARLRLGEGAYVNLCQPLLGRKLAGVTVCRVDSEPRGQCAPLPRRPRDGRQGH